MPVGRVRGAWHVPELLHAYIYRACPKNPTSRIFVGNFVEFRRFLKEVSDEVLDKGPKPEVLGQALTIHDDINPRRRVRGPGLQGVVGRVPSRGGTSDAMYNII